MTNLGLVLENLFRHKKGMKEGMKEIVSGHYFMQNTMDYGGVVVKISNCTSIPLNCKEEQCKGCLLLQKLTLDRRPPVSDG